MRTETQAKARGRFSMDGHPRAKSVEDVMANKKSPLQNQNQLIIETPLIKAHGIGPWGITAAAIIGAFILLLSMIALLLGLDFVNGVR